MKYNEFSEGPKWTPQSGQKMEAFDRIQDPAKKFISNCNRVLHRCSLPTAKIIKKTALSTAAGFAILGTVGFVFKLISLPVNHLIIGGMVGQ